MANGLSKNCSRKYWMTDRSPNWIRTFSEVKNFWTPIYTSSTDHQNGVVTSTVSCGRTFTTMVSAGILYAERGCIRSWDILSRNRSQSRSKYCSVRINAMGIWSWSRRTLPQTRIGAASPSYSEPEPQSKRMFPQTPKSESELTKILDLATAGIKILSHRSWRP